MFSKFFDRLNTNIKKESTKQPSPPPSRVKTPNPPSSYSPFQGRISSLSPPNTHNAQNFHFPQYSPTTVSSKKMPDIRRPNLISSNQVSNSNKFNENQTRIVTMPNLSCFPPFEIES